MLLIILLLIIIYLYINKKNNILILLLFISGFIISKNNLIENFSTDNLRFIPCSDDNDNHMYHNYQIQPINNIGNRNNILHTLYSDDINNMFIMPNCNIDPEYKFNKSYTGFFDRKIFSLDSVQQNLNDNHNMIKDSLLYNDPFTYRHPRDLQTKIVDNYDENFRKNFERYLDNNEEIHYSFNRGLEYKTCGNIDNNGRKYHCPYPYIFNYKNKNVLCTENNEYCRNVCCTSP